MVVIMYVHMTIIAFQINLAWNGYKTEGYGPFMHIFIETAMIYWDRYP